MLRFLLAHALAFSLASVAFALHGGELEGVVMEEGFGPVAGAVVRVADHDLETTTDENGAFSLEGVPVGAVLIVEAEGFVEVEAAAEDALRIELLPEDEGEYGTTARVRADLDAMQASTERVEAAEIAALPTRTAAEALRQVGGLTLVQHGSEGKGYQYFLRGFDAAHGADLRVTVEGVALNEWSNIHAQAYLDLGLILPEFIETIDVTKGPFDLDQGAFAMAGSANYRLGVAPSERGARLSISGGTTGRGRVFGAYTSDDGEHFVGAALTHDQGFGAQRRLDRATVNARSRLLQRGRTELSAFALASFADFEIPGTLRNDDVRDGVVPFDGAYDPATGGRSARALAGVTLEHQTSNGNVEGRLYAGHRRLDLLENFTGFLIDEENGDRRGQAHQSSTFGAQVAYHRHLGDHVTLDVGGGYEGEYISQSERAVGQAEEVLDTRRSLSAMQSITHARAGVRLEPVRRLRVDLGVRADWMHIAANDRTQGALDGSGSELAISPRASVRAQATDHLSFFASYGRGFRPPEARAFTSFDAGDTGLGEEVFGGEPSLTVSDSVEVGSRVLLHERATLVAAAFATRIERESVFDHVSGVTLELNGTRRLGGELRLESRPVDWLELSAGATLVDARFRESGSRVPFAPWLTANASAILRHPSGVGGGLRWLFVAPRHLPHGARGAALSRLDASVSYAYRWLRLQLAVENVLNTQLREGEYHYASDFRLGRRRSELPVLHTTAGPPLNARLTVGVVY
ncbi:MAG: TonB-dependent receptor [Myxococcota bacterium]